MNILQNESYFKAIKRKCPKTLKNTDIKKTHPGPTLSKYRPHHCYSKNNLDI